MRGYGHVKLMFKMPNYCEHIIEGEKASSMIDFVSQKSGNGWRIIFFASMTEKKWLSSLTQNSICCLKNHTYD